MKIHNVRFGFANNSSSSHSLIFLKKNHGVTDNAAYGNEFGWDNFTLVSREAKSNYVALLLWYGLREITSVEMAKTVIEKWCETEFLVAQDEGLDEDFPDGYIDHQSVINLPLTWDGKGIDKEFFTAFRDYILREDIAILGGNDNDEEGHPLANSKFSANIPLPTDMMGIDQVARYDPVYNYWSVFNRSHGGKVRFSFDNREAPTKAYAPELVDLKITNFCPYGCEFCYQDSTIEGKHASSNKLYKIIRGLADLKVFEVAIGGGEPTLHPGFLDILESCRSNGIIPNFTTKNLSWISDPSFRDSVNRNCGSFAFSADSGQEVNKLVATIQTYGIKIPVSVQCVLGVISPWEFYQVLRTCDKYDLTLTILGYKDVGRGTTFTKRQELDVIDQMKRALKEKVFPNICVDTEFALKYEEELKRLKVPKWMYHVQEGKFSAYIDAVEEKIGPSSYCAEDQYVKLEDLNTDRYFSDKLTNEIVRTFKNF